MAETQTQQTTTTTTQSAGPIPDQARHAEVDTGARAGTTRTIADADFDRLPAADRARYARTRDANNDSVWRERTAAGQDQQHAAGDQRLRVGDDGRLQFGELVASEQELRDLLVEKGQADARKAALPQTPEAYAAKLPETVKAPAGVDFKIDENSPALADLRRFAHANGWSQQQFSDALGIYASEKIAEATTIKAARDAEVTKLGANGAARVTALEHFFTGLIGTADAKAIGSMLVSARIVQAAEKVMDKYVGQGAASFSQAHRDVEQTGLSDEAWSTMSHGARLDYARSHDQSKFR